MTSRWERILDQKPVPLSEHLLDEVARLFAKDLAKWPLPVEELDLLTGAPFAPLLEAGRPRPPDVAYTEALKLARWELARQTDAFDDYMRNQRWLEHGLAPDDKQMLLFLSRWVVEELLALGEATEGRVKRSQMIDCVGRIERELVRLRTPPLGIC